MSAAAKSKESPVVPTDRSAPAAQPIGLVHWSNEQIAFDAGQRCGPAPRAARPLRNWAEQAARTAQPRSDFHGLSTKRSPRWVRRPIGRREAIQHRLPILHALGNLA
jgi:hypothetical protein